MLLLLRRRHESDHAAPRPAGPTGSARDRVRAADFPPVGPAASVEPVEPAASVEQAGVEQAEPVAPVRLSRLSSRRRLGGRRLGGRGRRRLHVADMAETHPGIPRCRRHGVDQGPASIKGLGRSRSASIKAVSASFLGGQARREDVEGVTRPSVTAAIWSASTYTAPVRGLARWRPSSVAGTRQAGGQVGRDVGLLGGRRLDQLVEAAARVGGRGVGAARSPRSGRPAGRGRTVPISAPVGVDHPRMPVVTRGDGRLLRSRSVCSIQRRFPPRRPLNAASVRLTERRAEPEHRPGQARVSGVRQPQLRRPGQLRPVRPGESAQTRSPRPPPLLGYS